MFCNIFVSLRMKNVFNIFYIRYTFAAEIGALIPIICIKN